MILFRIYLGSFNYKYDTHIFFFLIQILLSAHYIPGSLLSAKDITKEDLPDMVHPLWSLHSISGNTTCKQQFKLNSITVYKCREWSRCCVRELVGREVKIYLGSVVRENLLWDQKHKRNNERVTCKVRRAEFPGKTIKYKRLKVKNFYHI